MSLHFRTLHTPTEHVFANLVCVFSVSRSHFLVLFAEAIFRIMLLHIMLWILCWAVHIFVHIMFTMGCLHFFCPSVLRPVKLFFAAEEPAAGEELAAEELAAEEPAAGEELAAEELAAEEPAAGEELAAEELAAEEPAAGEERDKTLIAKW